LWSALKEVIEKMVHEHSAFLIDIMIQVCRQKCSQFNAFNESNRREIV